MKTITESKKGKNSVEEIQDRVSKKKQSLQTPRKSKEELNKMKDVAKETPQIVTPQLQNANKLSPEKAVLALDQKVNQIVQNVNQILGQLSTATKEMQLKMESIYERIDNIWERFDIEKESRKALSDRILANSKMIDVFLQK